MQYVNDDMDELFRRAAENYPLDTDGADWDKIAVALEKTSPVSGRAEKNSKYRLLWLLLLLPFSLICTNLVNNGKPGQKAFLDNQVNTIKGIPDSSLFQKTFNGPIEKNPSIGFSLIQNSQTAVQKQSIPENTTASARVYEKKGFSEMDYTESYGQNRKTSISGDAIPGKEVDYNPIRNMLFLPVRQFEQFSIIAQSAHHKYIVPAKKDLHSKAEESKRFYVGILGGLDASAVRFQKVQQLGNDLGILMGFDISKRWSVEAGIFTDKKSYYTDGEYFNASKIYLPANSKITWVAGNCRMWEIPVSVKYSFKQKKNSSWFAAAGVSSYLMKEENYNYNYYYTLTGQNVERAKSYSNASRNLLSVAQISVGYTHRLGKFADLRIEPYLKYAVNGAGVGSLPLQSAGFHIGLTKKLF
jgi:hypothetical protein